VWDLAPSWVTIEAMFDQLNTEDRLRLIRFVCAFAWSDLEVRAAERDFVIRLVKAMEFGRDERQQVEGWLKHPPPPEEVDPMLIPIAHKKLFLTAAADLIRSDGEVDPREAEDLALLRELLGG